MTAVHVADAAREHIRASAGAYVFFGCSGLERWRARLASDGVTAQERQTSMYQANPAFIPRNHLVEAAIRAAEDEGNLQPFHDLADTLANPWDYDPGKADYARPPQQGEVVHQAFCGT